LRSSVRKKPQTIEEFLAMVASFMDNGPRGSVTFTYKVPSICPIIPLAQKMEAFLRRLMEDSVDDIRATLQLIPASSNVLEIIISNTDPDDLKP